VVKGVCKTSKILPRRITKELRSRAKLTVRAKDPDLGNAVQKLSKRRR